MCICLGFESIKGDIGLKEEILRERGGKRKEDRGGIGEQRERGWRKYNGIYG